jgi:hypothetical protein
VFGFNVSTPTVLPPDEPLPPPQAVIAAIDAARAVSLNVEFIRNFSLKN